MSNVLQFFPLSPDRTCQLRHWFVEQGMERAGHVAAVSVAITTDGVVNAKGCGIEPEHAEVMLEELRALVSRLEGVVADNAPSTLAKRHKGHVIPLQTQVTTRYQVLCPGPVKTCSDSA